MKSNSQVKTYDPRHNTLAKLCVERIEDLFENLKVDVTVSGKKYVGICPIHGDSDNEGTLNIYYDGWSVPGYWKCRSKSCQTKFGKTILGFIRGRLSSMKKGYHWKKNPQSIYSFPDTLNYVCDFLKVKINSIKIDEKEEERRRFIAECKAQLNNGLIHNNSNITRNVVLNNLMIPSEYFLSRGYSSDVLCTYDVGLAKKSKLETKNRVIVPLYNENEILIGYTCRSIFDKCNLCKSFHDPNEECPSDKNLYSKWRHMGFNAEENLYNYWKAKEYIKNTNTAILVEGPGDVWRLEENGIHNSVGMFGHTLHNGQERLLANAQCMAMIVLTDSDEAGINGAKEIKRKYGRLYRMYFPNISEHDAGDMNEDAITENIKPLIDKAMRY